MLGEEQVLQKVEFEKIPAERQVPEREAGSAQQDARLGREWCPVAAEFFEASVAVEDIEQEQRRRDKVGRRPARRRIGRGRTDLGRG